LAKHHRQAEAESARSRSIGGSSAARPSAVTQPVGTKSARGPRPVGHQARPKAKSAGDANRRSSAKPRPKYRVSRKTRPEHTRIVDETEEEKVDDGLEQAEDGEDDAEDVGDEDGRMMATSRWSQRILLMKAGSTHCREAIWTLTKTLCTRALCDGAPNGCGGRGS
jgi:hypothetical protein